MAETLTLSLVTPERPVLDGVPCEAVTLPTEGGEIGLLPGHVPLVTLLGIGVVRYRAGRGGGAVAVRGGFAEIAADRVRILADVAASPDEVDVQRARAERQAGEGRRSTVAGEEELDAVNADIAYAEARIHLGPGEA